MFPPRKTIGEKGSHALSIHWPILRQLLSRPRRVFTVDDRGVTRGIELLVGMMHVAAAVRSRCDSRTLGLLIPTSGAFPVAALAGWSLGKVVVPLNYLLKREELDYVVADSGMDTVVASRALVDFMGFRPKVKNLILLEDIAFRSVPEPLVPASARDEDLGVLLYTSGTSGKPKGVMLSHGNVTANVGQVRGYIDITDDDIILGVLPQFHSFGMTVLTLMPLMGGLKSVYTARFVPHKLVKLIREHRPTVFVAIPSMYNAILSVKDATPADFASLRFVVSGGEPLPEATFTRFRERFGVTVNEGYGLTETSPVSNWCRPDEWRAGSVGRALPEIEQRVVDANTGAVLGIGQDGEVQMRGPNVMQGYYRLPEESRAAFTDDCFFKTGDMGQIDDDGHLRITGRIKEMLIVGGENVFPREIEEVLNRHESIAASGVVGRTDPMRGEVPVAFVEMKEGFVLDEGALKRWCREFLAGYKVPDEVRHMEPLPRNATGKIMRKELKKLV